MRKVTQRGPATDAHPRRTGRLAGHIEFQPSRRLSLLPALRRRIARVDVRIVPLKRG